MGLYVLYQVVVERALECHIHAVALLFCGYFIKLGVKILV